MNREHSLCREKITEEKTKSKHERNRKQIVFLCSVVYVCMWKEEQGKKENTLAVFALWQTGTSVSNYFRRQIHVLSYFVSFRFFLFFCQYAAVCWSSNHG